MSNKKKSPKEVLKAVKTSSKRLGGREHVTDLILRSNGIDDLPPKLFDDLPALISLDCLDSNS